MTLEAIRKRVSSIRKMADDDETAHWMEDQLRRDFIAYVAELDSPLATKALAVLATDEIRFARWCA